ncbi:MAG: carboxypeptidase regulatory-like domain-containing protein, partial [Leptospiraceae bacterium]|nr:carboxypeptidase regulatory-like domain-containing protein [Leptospiraceae bacterium]
DREVNFKLLSQKSSYWGSSLRGIGEVYDILVKDVPLGVHKITVKADDYPEVTTNYAITSSKENILELKNSMSGFGMIEGQVFYKTLDNPVINHKVYMPTIKSIVGNRVVKTDKDGKFWFTTLIPGEYEIKASFAENLKLNNSMIKVKEGEVTKVQVILNVKLPGMRTKY